MLSCILIFIIFYAIARFFLGYWLDDDEESKELDRRYL